MVADRGLLHQVDAVFAIFPPAIAFAGFRHHLAVLVPKTPAPISPPHRDKLQSAFASSLDLRETTLKLRFGYGRHSVAFHRNAPRSRPLTAAAIAELMREDKMSKDHDSYYAAEVEEHFRRGRGLSPYTTGGLVIAGLVGAGIGWLIYDRMSARAEQERRDEARRINKANARRALEMKKACAKAAIIRKPPRPTKECATSPPAHKPQCSDKPARPRRRPIVA